MKTNVSPALVSYLANLSSNPTDWQGFVADLYTITLVDGVTIYRFTTSDTDLLVGGHTFLALTPAHPGTPTAKRSMLKSTVGLSVDSLTLVLVASPLAVFSNGVTFLAGLQQGYLDNATVLVERITMPTYGDTSLGTVIQFFGTVGEISNIGSVSATIKVKSLTEILNTTNMPRNLYQSGCRHTLYDAGCTLSKASFQVSGTVQSGSTVASITTNLTQPGPANPPVSAPTVSTVSSGGLNQNSRTYYIVTTYLSAIGETTASPQAILVVPANQVARVTAPSFPSGVSAYNVYVGQQPGVYQLQTPVPLNSSTNWTESIDGISLGIPPPINPINGYFAEGVIMFTSGANNGVNRSVVGYDAAHVVSVLPSLLIAPSNGDTFVIVPGCDKQMSTCSSKFSNLIHFGGEPFIPTPISSL